MTSIVTDDSRGDDAGILALVREADSLIAMGDELCRGLTQADDVIEGAAGEIYEAAHKL